MVTRCAGPSQDERPSSSSADPIRKLPAAISFRCMPSTLSKSGTGSLRTMGFSFPGAGLSWPGGLTAGEESVPRAEKWTSKRDTTPMVANGRQYLHAAVLYENMVIESHDQKLRDPLVALYPRE